MIRRQSVSINCIFTSSHGNLGPQGKSLNWGKSIRVLLYLILLLFPMRWGILWPSYGRDSFRRELISLTFSFLLLPLSLPMCRRARAVHILNQWGTTWQAKGFRCRALPPQGSRGRPPPGTGNAGVVGQQVVSGYYSLTSSVETSR